MGPGKHYINQGSTLYQALFQHVLCSVLHNWHGWHYSALLSRRETSAPLETLRPLVATGDSAPLETGRFFAFRLTADRRRKRILPQHCPTVSRLPACNTMGSPMDTSGFKMPEFIKQVMHVLLGCGSWAVSPANIVSDRMAVWVSVLLFTSRCSAGIAPSSSCASTLSRTRKGERRDGGPR